MIKIAVVGCTGKLGSMIAKIILNSDDIELAYAIGRKGNEYVGNDISSIVGGKNSGVIITDEITLAETCDVFIDCTNAETFIHNNLNKYKQMKKPLVIATTGIDELGKNQIEELSKLIPVFITGNFSIALHNFIETLKFAVRLISDDTDVQIIEYHHNQKKDAPSGTAIMIQEALIKENPRLDKQKVNISSIRGGNIFGEHVVLFANSKDEITEYKHRVSSRESFSSGAVTVATWMAHQPVGLYSMDDFCKHYQ